MKNPEGSAIARNAGWIVLTVAASIAAMSPMELRAQASTLAGGAGGRAFVRVCPPGQLVVGFDAWHDQWMDRIQPRCRSADAVGGWGAGQVVSHGPAAGGEGGSGQLTPTECPRDAFVTELVVTHGAYVHGLRATCRRPDGSAATLDEIGASGTFEELGPVGQALGGTRQEVVQCPQGTRASGIAGRSGIFVDALRLECTSFGSSYIEDTALEVGRAGAIPGGGGTAFVTQCGPDERMVGLVARESDHVGSGLTGVWLTGLRPVCSIPPTWDPAAFAQALSRSANPATSRAGARELVAEGSFGSSVGGSDGETIRLMCPQDTFVEAIDAHHADYLNGVRLLCRTADRQRTGTTGLAGSERDRRDILQCPADMMAWGLVGRAGSSIDAVRLRCRGADRSGSPPRLLAILGDSYGSGEGAPDIPLTSEVGFLQGDERGQKAGWIDRMCHRSEKAGLLRGVRAFDDPDRRSFDFRTFACSGAEVNDGFIAFQSDPPEAGAPVDAQLEQMERWMRARGAGAVDAVLMSVGGNDAGFADRITDCMIGELQEDLMLNAVLFSCGTDPDFREIVRSQPQELARLYDDLAARLARLGPRRVYIRTYPDALQYQAAGGGIDYCGGFADPGVEPPSIFTMAHHAYNNTEGLTYDATSFVDSVFVRGINEQIVEAARRHGWIAITDWYEASAGHGYCSSDSWFNLASAAFQTQGDGMGVFHPNAVGYAAEADIVEAALESSWAPPRPVLSVGPAPTDVAPAAARAPRAGEPALAQRRPSLDGRAVALTGLRRRALAWTVTGPDTDLDKLWATLVYQVATVPQTTARPRASATSQPGHRNTTLAIPLVSQSADVLDYFVRSCEGDLCSDWSSGLRISLRAPVDIEGLAVSDIASAGSGAPRVPVGADAGVRITWDGAQGPPARVYQVAYGTEGRNGEIETMRVREVRARAQSVSEIRVGEVPNGADVFFVRACNDAGCSAWGGARRTVRAPAVGAERRPRAGSGLVSRRGAASGEAAPPPPSLAEIPLPSVEPEVLPVPPEAVRDLAPPR